MAKVDLEEFIKCQTADDVSDRENEPNEDVMHERKYPEDDGTVEK